MTNYFLVLFMIIGCTVPGLTQPDSHWSHDIEVDSSGIFYIAGRSSESAFLIIKYNAIGVQQNELSAPNSIHSDAAAALHIDPPGNIYATGFPAIPASISSISQSPESVQCRNRDPVLQSASG
ncbi:MAG: hypothetical protein U5R06_19305 [candidate division KSB1 bacterium]|nr:hypothetical protein [candidate division KSB1 bacterium]